MPSGLGGIGRLLWSGRQMKILQLAKILKFGNFNLKARLGCLNGFMVLIASSRYIYIYIYISHPKHLRCKQKTRPSKVES